VTELASVAARPDLLVYTDGASRNNPGRAASGYAIFRPTGEELEHDARVIGVTTNNVAEYEALLWAIERASAITNGSVRFHSDSELMVRQVSGRYAVRKEHLMELVARVQTAAGAFQQFKLVYVPREDPRIQLVDGLVNDVLDREGF
jgi:ribonuclease HI